MFARWKKRPNDRRTSACSRRSSAPTTAASSTPGRRVTAPAGPRQQADALLDCEQLLALLLDDHAARGSPRAAARSREADRPTEPAQRPLPVSLTQPRRSRTARARRLRSRRCQSCGPDEKNNVSFAPASPPLPNAMPHTPFSVSGRPARSRKRAVVRPAAAGAPKRIHMSVTEVRHEKVATVPAERRRREREPPRLVEHAHPPDPRDEVAGQVELVDVTAGRIVVAVDGRAADVRDEQVAAEQLDVVGREPRRDRRVAERRPRLAPAASGRRRRRRAHCGSRSHRRARPRRRHRGRSPLRPRRRPTISAWVDQPCGTVGVQARIRPSSHA